MFSEPVPRVEARLPAAVTTETHSARSSLPPQENTTPPRSIAVTCAEVRMRTPLRFNAEASCTEISFPKKGSILSAYSSTVTCLPQSAK